jgi:hypothetical protein
MTESTLPVEATMTLPTAAVSQPYWQMATSANTRRAYQSDIRHFISSGELLPTTRVYCITSTNKPHLSTHGLSPAIVSQIQRRALECQWPNYAQYSGHSLRCGFATAASQRSTKLYQLTKHYRKLIYFLPLKKYFLRMLVLNIRKFSIYF